MSQKLLEQSESDEEILQPISFFSPPNQILSKKYASDEKVVLKLMQEKKKCRKVERPQLQQKCQQLKKEYKQIFSCNDTLGFQLAPMLTDNLAYLKMNNKNYMKLKVKDNTYRFISGMFIPVEELISEDVKKSKNIYNTLPGIQFTEYHPLQNMEDSFGNNSKGEVKFSSNYDSANLFLALKKKQFQYDLILQNDINSKGNTQWFNFIVELPQQGTYRFNILNFTKKYSHYQDGMHIIYFSSKDHKAGLGGWTRGCTAITYEKSNIRREDSSSRKYYTLKFQYKCSYSSDKVTFSSFYPYTGLQFEKFIKNRILHRKPNLHMKMEKVKICQTLSGLPIYVLSIGCKKQNILQNPKSASSFNIRNLRQNKSVVIMARQHPGETQGSFIVEGIVDFLMENGEIDHLKKNINFFIFPMLNPDGVLYGNYRTNLAGTDLNRMWRNPVKNLHPQVYYVKKYLQLIHKSSPISMIIDLHGHSKSLNSFFYGNPVKKDNLSQTEDPRFFPYFCSKRMKQISFFQSTFSSSQNKKNSARIVLSELFPKTLVYTLENSFYGNKKDRHTVNEYTPEILQRIGKELLISYLEYERVIEKNPQIREKWMKEISELGMKEQNLSDGGSDSEAEEDLLNLTLSEQQIRQEQNSIFNSGSIDSYRKDKKLNFIQRNLMMKSYVQKKKVTKYNRNLFQMDPSVSKIRQKKLKDSKKFEQVGNQGFLSIVRIKGSDEKDLMSFNDQYYSNEDNLRRHDSRFYKTTMMQKLAKKKIRIEDAVNSCSGMRTFLKTMGIPIDKKVL